jgi:membrane protein implicated in regulation of membrane protease activity
LADYGLRAIWPLALPVAFYLGRDEQRGRTIAVAWNILGILDLAVAISLGFLTTTGWLATLGITPAASGLAYPLVMIPAFAVPLSLILHGVSIWQLARRAKRDVSSRDEGGATLARTPA